MQSGLQGQAMSAVKQSGGSGRMGQERGWGFPDAMTVSFCHPGNMQQLGLQRSPGIPLRPAIGAAEMNKAAAASCFSKGAV